MKMTLLPRTLLFSLLILWSAVVVCVSGSQCTLCADGSAPAAGAKLGGVSCSAIAATLSNSTPANSTICAMLQAHAFQYCGCPTYPSSFCSMCDYSSGQPYVALPKKLQSYPVPGTNMTCAEAALVPKDGSSNMCSLIQASAWYCGCPNTTRSSSCPLCTSASILANGTTVPTPNDRPFPPFFNTTCAQVDRALGVSCSNNAILNSISGTVDVQAYCGCTASNTTTSGNCTVCGPGVSVLNPKAVIVQGANAKLTCADLSKATALVTSETACAGVLSAFQNATLSATCCQPLPPTMSPTGTPPTIVPVVMATTPTVAGGNPAPTVAAAPTAQTSAAARTTIVPLLRWVGTGWSAAAVFWIL